MKSASVLLTVVLFEASMTMSKGIPQNHNVSCFWFCCCSVNNCHFWVLIATKSVSHHKSIDVLFGCRVMPIFFVFIKYLPILGIACFWADLTFVANLAHWTLHKQHRVKLISPVVQCGVIIWPIQVSVENFSWQCGVSLICSDCWNPWYPISLQWVEAVSV